ncbi:MAG TPA: hypothetical protein VI160_07995 [Gemmatimonadales bacterium]
MRPWAVLLPFAAAAACGGPSRAPVCGLAQVAGPTVIQQQLGNLRSVITDAPRGLPSSLPAYVVRTAIHGRVLVGYDGGRLVMGYEGGAFPTFPDTTEGYGLLVVDDTSQRAEGVLVYESARPPADYPRLGVVSGGSTTLPVFGVRLDWASMSNPRCPLLGDSTAAH